MTPGILATLATKNPAFMYGMLPVFGAYEQGSSYREATMSGLSHKEAARVANLNALSEIGTELIPLPFVGKTLKKYWKANGSSVQQFARDGFTTTSLELIGENVNSIFQETNKALSGVNKISFFEKSPPPSAIILVKDQKLYIPLEGLIEPKDEIVRNTKNLAKFNKIYLSLDLQLKNKNFIKNAPADLIKDRKIQLEDLE